MSTTTSAEWVLRCDGGSRGNPGPGAFGYVLLDPAGTEIEARGETIGSVTNNVAEYRALIAGLEAAARHSVPALRVCMDSELVIRQMKGEYRVKNEGLKPLHATAKAAGSRIPKLKWVAVRREENARADALVNEALDRAVQSESPR